MVQKIADEAMILEQMFLVKTTVVKCALMTTCQQIQPMTHGWRDIAGVLDSVGHMFQENGFHCASLQNSQMVVKI